MITMHPTRRVPRRLQTIAFALAAVVAVIDLHWGEAHWPTFNLADAAIVCGVALLLLTVRGSDSRAASLTLGRAAR